LKFLNVVKSSENYAFEDEKPPRAPRAKDVSYALELYKVFIDSVVLETSKWASSI
jgi:hypothetical protein